MHKQKCSNRGRMELLVGDLLWPSGSRHCRIRSIQVQDPEVHGFRDPRHHGPVHAPGQPRRCSQTFSPYRAMKRVRIACNFPPCCPNGMRRGEQLLAIMTQPDDMCSSITLTILCLANLAHVNFWIILWPHNFNRTWLLCSHIALGKYGDCKIRQVCDLEEEH